MQDCNMNGRVLLVVVRYLVIAVALLHASRGATPRLFVIYHLNDVDNKNELECYDGSTLIQSGAIMLALLLRLKCKKTLLMKLKCNKSYV